MVFDCFLTFELETVDFKCVLSVVCLVDVFLDVFEHFDHCSLKPIKTI